MALFGWARASLRYRIARTLLMEHLKTTMPQIGGTPPLARCAIEWPGSSYIARCSRPHQRPSLSAQKSKRLIFEQLRSTKIGKAEQTQ
jgi:hypothetical protein